jgi:hypothetical protein
MQYSIPAGILYQELSGEGVLLNLTTAEYFHLNEVGHAAWEMIRAGADRKVVEESLTREFDTSPEQVQSDLDAFLNRMVELKLLTPQQECEIIVR